MSDFYPEVISGGDLKRRSSDEREHEGQHTRKEEHEVLWRTAGNWCLQSAQCSNHTHTCQCIKRTWNFYQCPQYLWDEYYQYIFHVSKIKCRKFSLYYLLEILRSENYTAPKSGFFLYSITPSDTLVHTAAYSYLVFQVSALFKNRNFKFELNW